MKTRAAKGYTKAQWDAIRDHLRKEAEARGGMPALAAEVGIKSNTLASFVLGRSKGLSVETVRILEKKGLLPDFKEPEPLQEWTGEVRTVKEVAEEKGYCAGTIRKWAKDGKLNYIKNGRRILIAVDEKYEAVPKSEKALMRERIAELETENVKLKSENRSLKVQVMDLGYSVKNLEEKIQGLETRQLEFNFEPATASPKPAKKNRSKTETPKVAKKSTTAKQDTPETPIQAQEQEQKFYQAVDADNDNREVCGLYFANVMEIGEDGVDRIAWEKRNGTVKSGVLEIEQCGSLHYDVLIDKTRQVVEIPNRLARELCK